nr:unnamed protein product [Callosobruchus chinensis]
MTKFIKESVCEQLVISKILYSTALYHPCLDQNTLKRLQKIQNCCCRFVNNLTRFNHTSTYINDMRWLKVDKLFQCSSLTTVHKIKLSRRLLYLYKKLISRQDIIHPNRIIRYPHRFTMPHHKTSIIYNRSFTYNAVSSYNSTPNEFKNMTFIKFKYNLKYHLPRM